MATGPRAGARAPLALVAGEEGIEGAGVGVHRDEQYIAAREEDALGAVAVMDVDVDDGDRCEFGPHMLGGDGDIVEQAEAARQIAIGVMAGRAAKAI